MFPRCNLVAVQCRVNAHLLSHQSQSGMPGTLVPPLFFIHARARFYCSLIASKTLLIVCYWYVASCDTTQPAITATVHLIKSLFLLSFARCGNDLSKKRHVSIFQEQTTFTLRTHRLLLQQINSSHRVNAKSMACRTNLSIFGLSLDSTI